MECATVPFIWNKLNCTVEFVKVVRSRALGSDDMRNELSFVSNAYRLTGFFDATNERVSIPNLNLISIVGFILQTAFEIE